MLLDRLHKHLAALRRENLLQTWTDRAILAGGAVDSDIAREFERVQLYLLLVSASFINSDYCFEREFEIALRRYRDGEAIIVPIIVRECDWKISALKQFKVLPTDGRPVISRHWHSEDEAFADVVSGLRTLIQNFPIQHSAQRPRRKKPTFVSNESHIDETQRAALKRICDEVVERLTASAVPKGEAELKQKTGRYYGIVWSQFNERFGINQLAELPRREFDEAKTWFLQYRASKDSKLKRANPQKYRNTLLKTIHALVRELGWSPDDLYVFASSKLGYAKPIDSLSDIGVKQLELVRDRVRYELSKRKAKTGQRRALRNSAQSLSDTPRVKPAQSDYRPKSATLEEGDDTQRPSLDELLDVFSDRNQLRIIRALQPYLGAPVTVKGRLHNVNPLLDLILTIVKVESDKPQPLVSCRFDRKKWEAAFTEQHSVGDIVTVRGKVAPDQNGQSLQVAECEIDDP